MLVTATLTLVLTCCGPTVTPGDCASCVTVAVDLDPSTPGYQTTLFVEPGTTVIEDVAIWLFDPNGSAAIVGIGYIGGLNRGIAFGHVNNQANLGLVSGLTVTAVNSAAPGHAGAFVDGGTQPMFDGPEVQYFEAGGTPAVIPRNPPMPVLQLDIELSGAVDGDAFIFHLGDMTAAWLAGGQDGGAFSTIDFGSLDAGGDACPDGTATLYGLDADPAAPAPPAPFCVDYVDGGGATIVVSSDIPALRTWGLIGLAAVLCIAGVLIIRRQSMPSC